MTKAAELAKMGEVLTNSQIGGRRNIVINGAMQVAQRGTTAVTSSSGAQYPVDRFFFIRDTATTAVMTAEQSTTAPAGFVNSVKVTTTTAQESLAGTDYHRFAQNIEGLNVADLGWGTANAKTVTLSFWVRSSLTGTFGGSFGNSAWNRTYPFTYTISTADTWEQKSITIAGDTSGTWLTTNGIGLRVDFGLGVGTTYSGTAGAWAGALYISATGATNVSGTLNATWNITGIQLEVGEQATPFEHRSFGEELALCERYYQTWGGNDPYEHLPFYVLGNGTVANFNWGLPVEMRVAPSLSTSGTWSIQGPYGGSVYTVGSFVLANTSTKTIRGDAQSLSGSISTNTARVFAVNSTTVRFNLDSEL